MEKKLKEVYYDLKHPAGYVSIRKLSKATGINEKKVKEWLIAQSMYTLYKQARKLCPTRHYIVNDIDEQWQAYLANVTHFAYKNQGYHFILAVIDIFHDMLGLVF